jgi:ADP-heptose:LPS heptosyltransferase
LIRRVLVIRLGALGDFILSIPAFAAIRAHETQAEITLLTTASFVDLARRSPYFDAVIVDDKPPLWHLPGMLRLSRTLSGFDFVYDLQTSTRSSRYFALARRPPWSGIAPGSSHPHANATRDAMHTRERQREQLLMAGVQNFPQPDLGWLTNGTISLPPSPFALLVPGAAPHRPAKRWPVACYADLAGWLEEQGVTPVVIGSAGETALAAAIPGSLDLTGLTTIADIARLAAAAAVAIGNDTGPMHVAAAVGCRSVVLFSAESDPCLTAPRGPDGGWPTVLRVDDLADLSVDRVAAALA